MIDDNLREKAKRQWEPYDALPAFWLGYQDYIERKPLRNLPDVAGQAYDRGAQFARDENES